MTNHRTAIRKLALSAILLAIPFNAALAQDATAIADRLKAAATSQGLDISWTGISGDASSMVLEGVSVKAAGEAESLPIGNVTLSGVTEENGGYTIETLTTAPFSKSEDGVAVDISSFVVNGLKIPAEGAADPASSMTMYESADLASMTVRIADKTAFALQGLGFEMTPPEGGKPLEFTGAAEKFSVDLTLVEDPQYKTIIDQLGYQNLNGFFEMAGSWQPTDGRWAVSQYDVSIENAGTFGITMDFGGFTPDVVNSIREISTKMAEASDGADNSGSEMAMLGLMQQITFHSITARFDDDTLTSRAVDVVATQQRQKPADIINLAKAAIPFALMSLNSPELTAEVSAAVNTYLDDPQSIEVAAVPPAPVPFALIGATAMSSPDDAAQTTNALWKILGVKVTANEK